MVSWTPAGTPLLFPELDSSIGNIVPAVEDMLRRVSGVEPTVINADGGIQLAARISFSDGIGSGAVVAEIFRYRDAVRIDLRIDHNRVFADADGTPSNRRCFLNDYVASVTIEPGASDLPAPFVRGVVGGATAARDAVRRHNRRARGPWEEMRVAATAAQE